MVAALFTQSHSLDRETTSSSTPPQRRRGQQQQQGSQQRNQRTWFEGAINELKRHIYDLVGSRSADLISMTTRVIAVYVGGELGGDICQSVETYSLATLPHPIRPPTPPPAPDGTAEPVDLLDMDIYREEVKEYVMQRNQSMSCNGTG